MGCRISCGIDSSMHTLKVYNYGQSTDSTPLQERGLGFQSPWEHFASDYVDVCLFHLWCGPVLWCGSLQNQMALPKKKVSCHGHKCRL